MYNTDRSFKGSIPYRKKHVTAVRLNRLPNYLYTSYDLAFKSARRMSRDPCRCGRDMSPIGYLAPFDIFFTAKVLRIRIRIRRVSGWSLRPPPCYISVPARCSLCPLYAVLDADFPLMSHSPQVKNGSAVW